MTQRLRLAIAQLNPLVGDIAGNTRQVIEWSRRARAEHHADVVIFSELFLVGYPPEDLLFRRDFLDLAVQAVAQINGAVPDIDIVLGYPERRDDKLYNAAALLRRGKIANVYHKQVLPNYSVFDEMRYFTPGTAPCVVDLHGLPVGLTVCEDIWTGQPARLAADAGARLLININASPFHAGKSAERHEVLRRRIRETGLPLVYANQFGGQDELIFDGQSCVLDAGGALRLQAPAFAEGLFVCDLEWDGNNSPVRIGGELAAETDELEKIYQALVTAVRDYVRKNRFPGIVIGLSGGIDSALSLAIAVDALGAEAVEAVMLPSRHTSAMSLEDARQMADNLGVLYRELPIEAMYREARQTLAEEFAGRTVDATEENMQARCRGLLLMAISNKKGKMVLTTGNKSEMAVGYATLYGDMVGGFNALKDVPKTLVYQLAARRNEKSPVIPRRSIERPPSAELAENQQDSDSLPPYEILDPILDLYIEQDCSPDQIVARGFDAATVQRVADLVDRNEYKRRQAAPGVRISRRAFGKDRRYPITSGYRRT